MKKIISVILVICIALSLFATGCTVKEPEETAPESEYFSEISPAYGETVALIDGPIYYYWRNYEEPGLSDTFGFKKGAMEDLYLPKPLTISWKFADDTPLYYYIDISKNSDMTDSTRYISPRNSVDIENLYTAATYYYTISAVTEGGIISSPVYKVKTENTVRTISLTKVSNTRDLGGWLTEDGTQRVKEGIIYRGGNVDSISKKYKYEFLGVYGIKTEIDCREGSTASPFSKTEGFNYITVCAPYYVGTTAGINATAKKYQEALATEIRTFADPENFPIYFHCAIGRDRTGTLALFILSILGVSKSDIYKDYELYRFSSIAGGDNMIGTMKPNIDNLVKYLEGYSSQGSLKEGAVNFAKEKLGITDDEIEAIRKNCLEPVTAEDYSSTTPLENVTKEFTVDERTFSLDELKTTSFVVKEGSFPDFEILTLSEDNESGKIKYNWSDDAFGGNGGFVKGTHTLTIKVMDVNKNIIAEQTLTFNVI